MSDESFKCMDESVKISEKTWNRTIDSINKVGYSDGVVDGQAASFQSSFDKGYKQGFQFGFHIGLRNAMINQSQETSENKFQDPRRINCQICLNNISNDNIVNLFNRQHERNMKYLPVQLEF